MRVQAPVVRRANLLWSLYLHIRKREEWIFIIPSWHCFEKRFCANFNVSLYVCVCVCVPVYGSLRLCMCVCVFTWYSLFIHSLSMFIYNATKLQMNSCIQDSMTTTNNKKGVIACACMYTQSLLSFATGDGVVYHK